MPRESKTILRGELPNYLADAARSFEANNPVDKPGLVVEEITVTYRYADRDVHTANLRYELGVHDEEPAAGCLDHKTP